MSTLTTHSCDLCGKPATELKQRVPVCFVTDQTDGRYTKPYLQYADLDFCKACLEVVTAAQPIEGQGAQGYNTYSFTEAGRLALTRENADG